MSRLCRADCDARLSQLPADGLAVDTEPPRERSHRVAVLVALHDLWDLLVAELRAPSRGLSRFSLQGCAPVSSLALPRQIDETKCLVSRQPGMEVVS